MRIVRCFVFASFVLGIFFAARAADAAPRQSHPAAASVRNITIDDYFQIRDVSQPELSPDGQWVAYAVRMKRGFGWCPRTVAIRFP
jgi:hypothetical protein